MIALIEQLNANDLLLNHLRIAIRIAMSDTIIIGPCPINKKQVSSLKLWQPTGHQSVWQSVNSVSLEADRWLIGMLAACSEDNMSEVCGIVGIIEWQKRSKIMEKKRCNRQRNVIGMGIWFIPWIKLVPFIVISKFLSGLYLTECVTQKKREIL